MAVTAALQEIQRRIDAAAERAGRDPQDIALLPVSKFHSTDAIREAIAAGYRSFGENRLQEIQAKHRDVPEARFIMIGRAQSNKAQIVVDSVAELHSLDSLNLASKLNRRLLDAGRRLPVLVQVNTSNEPQKAGIHPDEAVSFARQLLEFDQLNVQGLMTMAMFTDDTELVAGCFKRLRDVQSRLQDEVPELSWHELSMGMSNDFALAIEHGSTIVRIGTAIFGQRPAL